MGTTGGTHRPSRVTEPHVGPAGSTQSRRVKGVATVDDDGHPHERGFPNRIDILNSIHSMNSVRAK